jgi:hypothetical protein
MIHTTDGDFPRPPTELIARLLLESARQDPSLLGRSQPRRRDVDLDRIVELPRLAGASGPMQLMATAPLDFSHQLEDLVSIAVASARQAEDASQLAHQASSAARRSMAVVVGSGVLGILLAVGVIAGTYLHRGAGIIMAATDAVGADLPPDSPPRPMDGQSPASPPQMPMTPPATVSGSATDALSPAKAPAGMLIPTASAQPAVHSTIVPPVYHAPPAGYSARWPSNNPPSRNYYRGASGGRVVYPPFFLALRRDINGLFRVIPPHS